MAGLIGLLAGGVFEHISFTELKNVAMNVAGDALFFNADDVFLNEVQDVNQAAAIAENAGYDSAKTYYFILGTRFESLTSFVAATSPRETYGYYEVAELVAPADAKSDSTLTAPLTSVWVATSIDVPHGNWGFIRPVGITDQYLRFYILDLLGKTAGSAGGSAVAAERIAFPFGTDDQVFIGHNSSGKILVSTNDTSNFWPTELIIRT